MASIEDAHATLLRNDDLQFSFQVSPQKPTESSMTWHWSPSLGGLTPVWVILGLATLLIVGLTVSYLRRRPRVPASSEGASTASAEPVGIPLQVAQAALSDADGLAARGRFSEAAHVLLACGIDEIMRRYPTMLRPAYTSRDIARMSTLPESMRRAFGRIATSVEIGLFGGRAISAADYAECRQVFVTSALAGGS